MIRVTKLNGKAFSLNALYIETVEEFPDTTITLTTGKKYIVSETETEVAQRIVQFYRHVQLLSNPFSGGDQYEE